MIIKPRNNKSQKDKIKWLSKNPLVLFGIFFDKGHVGWGVFGLDEAEIGACDLGVWVHVGEGDGPDAGAGGDVEDVFGGFDGGVVELAVQEEGD